MAGPNVIDELVVTLGLDASKFTAAQAKAVNDLKSTVGNMEAGLGRMNAAAAANAKASSAAEQKKRDETKRTQEALKKAEQEQVAASKASADRNKKAAESYRTLRNEALAAFATFVGIKSVVR